MKSFSRTALAAAMLSLSAAPVSAQWSAADQARADSVAALQNGLRDDFRAVAAEAGIAEPRGVIVLAGTRAGVQVRAAESNAPDSVILAALERARPRFAAWPVDSIWTDVRLDADAVRPEKGSIAIAAAPRFVNHNALARELAQYAAAHRVVGPDRRFRVIVRALATREGRVAYAEIQTSSGTAAIDEEALKIAWMMRFEPARYNGRPVDVWTLLPVSVMLGGMDP